MAKISFWIFTQINPCLERVQFIRDLERIVSVRGKNGGVYGNIATFQWTAAVQAMVVLFLRHKLFGSNLSPDDYKGILYGNEGTNAASLDYAITKKPLWIQDMFGCDNYDKPLCTRLFRRTNPERKRPGPVLVAINHKIIRPEEITFYINNMEATCPQALQNLLHMLEVHKIGAMKNDFQRVNEV